MLRRWSRRSFLGAASALPLLATPSKPQKIGAVELIRVSGHVESTSGVDQQYQATMLDVYDELRRKPYRDNPAAEKRSQAVSAIYLRIRAGEGLQCLYGPIDAEAAIVIEKQFKAFLLGKDALAVEELWDQMYRSNRHARSGHMMMALSAVDNALWDLRGRYFQAPVYRLLGGPTRPNVEAYASCLGFSLEPEKVAAKVRELKQEGYRSQKWFMAWGPGDGPEGVRRSVDLVRSVREASGDDTNLMFDAFMSWQLDFAIAWARQAELYRPRWIEEAFPPDKLEAFVALRRATSIPVATGEHFYGRWEANRFLAAGAITVVQADQEWCGGVSELVKICNLASLYDAQVIPHGHSLHAALHVVASQSPEICPMVEYLITKMRTYYWAEKRPLVPAHGRIELPDAPGFGIEFDAAKVEKTEPFAV